MKISSSVKQYASAYKYNDMLFDAISETTGEVYVYIDCSTMFYFVGRFDSYNEAYEFMQSININFADWRVICK